jgi:ABC-type Zn uptake system ZnuABC Zn-binding protein ZnuA
LHDPEVDLHEEVVQVALTLALAAALAAPGQAAAQEKLHVVATSADLKALVEAVGDGRTEVESLAAPDQDPHAIELKPAQLAHLQRAALVVRVGLDHEPWLARTRLGEKTRVIDASQGVRLLQTETPRLRVERKAHVHAFGNTHYWLDPLNARPITAAILEALARLEPESRAGFEKNRDVFLQRLDIRIKKWTETLAPLRGTKVVVMHDSWSYFAERFGLDIVAAAEPVPGVSPAPSELAALYRRMREAGVRMVIADPHSNASFVRQIAEKSGATAITLLPSGTDYIGLFDENVARLASVRKQK